ncbi:calsequestrin-2-like [Zingiber officinale]|uniref:calsequestrin-2-like n=1 Tax=Zingiber officinale TaxID=94328 RepID=UPI001C4B28ED|nr:calsequestrin-2-like [Zingiber officinale]
MGREARAMLAQVAADYVEAVNLDFIAQVFCWYTSFSIRRVPMMDVVSMELSSTIFVCTNYSATISLLNISDNDDDDDYDDDDKDDDDKDEDNDDDDDEDDDDDDEDDYFDLVVDDDNFDLVVDDDYRTYFDSGSRPAFATAVEGLKMVTAEESDSCSICLEDFGMTAPVLAMLCGHLFHPGCLKKWLEQSCSCPLCRFSLPQEQW